MHRRTLPARTDRTMTCSADSKEQLESGARRSRSPVRDTVARVQLVEWS
jgi:hypothetical protein